MSYLSKRGAVYYFRRIVPAKLQPIIGKREFMVSLGTKDREEAKRLVPARILDTDAQLDAARKALGAVPGPSATDAAPARLRTRREAQEDWDREQEEFAEATSGLEPEELQEWFAEQAKLAEPSEPEPARSITKLFERWASAGSANANTVPRWRSKVAKLVKHLGHDDVTKVTRAALNAWIETLVAEGLTAKTITAGYLPAIRVPFTVAYEDEVIPVNTASALKVRAPKVVKLRERDLTDDEAATILKATVGPQPAKLAEDHARARRWVPWLCAYTGARVGEITQLRAKDIQQEDGVWFIHITPEAGSVKNAQARKVPLHSHLIEQGVTKLAKAGDETPLFYREGAGSAVNPASKVRAADIAKWVRSLGVEAPQPNHGWRHRFKSQAFAVKMDSEAADIAQGHVPRKEAGRYGQRGLPRLRDEIEKLRRYQIET